MTLYTFTEFAKLIKVSEHSIWHIVDVGDKREAIIAEIEMIMSGEQT